MKQIIGNDFVYMRNSN